MWKWLRRKESSEEKMAIRRLEELIRELSGEQHQALNDQLSKLTRLQYKNAQDMQARIERLAERVEFIAARQEANDAIRQLAEEQTRRSESLARQSIAILDDLDALSARLQGDELDRWKQLVQKWAGQTIGALEDAGIRELKVLGTGFDPAFSEAIGTVARQDAAMDAASVPYQIMEVVRRGFVNDQGHLLRKAQVITMEG